MSWFNTLGPCPNYVLFSKVKYIRNLAKLPFYRSADPKRLEEETSRIDKILVSNGFKGEKIASGRSAYLLSLAEKQFVDNEFIDSELSRTVIVGGTLLFIFKVIYRGGYGSLDLLAIRRKCDNRKHGANKCKRENESDDLIKSFHSLNFLSKYLYCE